MGLVAGQLRGHGPPIGARSFKTKMCEYLPDCPNGSSCTFAHHPSEIKRGPNYKTSLCRDFPNCPAGNSCNFAHGESDLRAPPNGFARGGGGSGYRAGGRGGGRVGAGGGPRNGRQPQPHGHNRNSEQARDRERARARARERELRERGQDRRRSRSVDRAATRGYSVSSIEKENSSGNDRKRTRSYSRDRADSNLSKASSSSSKRRKHTPSIGGAVSTAERGDEDDRAHGKTNGVSKRETKFREQDRKRARRSTGSSSATSSKPKKRRRVVEELSKKSPEELDELIAKTKKRRETAAAQLRQVRNELGQQKESMKEYETEMQECLSRLKSSLAASVKNVQALKEQSRNVLEEVNAANDSLAKKQHELTRAQSDHSELCNVVKERIEDAVASSATHAESMKGFTSLIKQALEARPS